MPIEVKKYTCQFRCRLRAQNDINTVSSHETTCWKNPVNQTCKTCKNEIYVTDSDGFDKWITRGCKFDAIDELFAEIQDDLKGSNSMHIRPLYNCPFHNKTTALSGEEFIAKVKDEIDQAKKDLQTERKHFIYFSI